MKYYAFEYKSGRYTTEGSPHPSTNRLSTAGSLKVFSSKEAREKWIDGGNTTAGMRGNCRESVTRKEARSLHLGMSVQQYIEYLNCIS